MANKSDVNPLIEVHQTQTIDYPQAIKLAYEIFWIKRFGDGKAYENETTGTRT